MTALLSLRRAPARIASSIAIAVTLFGAVLSCVSEPERAARLPPVATRHAPASNSASTSTPEPKVASAAPNTIGGDPAYAFEPPATLHLPDTLQTGERVPLLLLLHGFGVSSNLLVDKANLNTLANQKRFAYLAPEGTHDSLGRPFWNAGKACCDLEHRGPNDVKRLRELLDANSNNASIDPKRIFVIGYSNGGFMAQRLACDVGDRIAGLVSVAGAAPSPDVPCTQHSALAVLTIHGEADPIVHYGGGTVFDRTDVERHPSALDTAKFWAQQLACGATPRSLDSIDIEPYLPDRETNVLRYDDCRGAVEMWTVKGGGHYVALQRPALDALWNFIQAHPQGGA